MCVDVCRLLFRVIFWDEGLAESMLGRRNSASCTKTHDEGAGCSTYGASSSACSAPSASSASDDIPAGAQRVAKCSLAGRLDRACQLPQTKQSMQERGLTCPGCPRTPVTPSVREEENRLDD